MMIMMKPKLVVYYIITSHLELLSYTLLMGIFVPTEIFYLTEIFYFYSIIFSPPISSLNPVYLPLYFSLVFFYLKEGSVWSVA